MGRYLTLEPIKYTRLYTIWLNMRTRCNNPKCEYYNRYGGRGIKVCKEWDTYENFEEWANDNGYSSVLTLDRIDNNKGYSPNNCRWVTRKEQANNRKSSVFVTFKGESHTLAEWADIAGINYKRMMNRVYRGYPFELCLYKGKLRRGERKEWEEKWKK